MRFLLSASIAFAVMLGFPLPTIASDESVAIEEIVVTARKREESSQDVPVAITALSAELESASIRNLTDLNGYSPNLIISEDGSRGGGGANINIRGISPTRTDDNSFDAPIAVVIDDVFLGSLAGQVMENFDLERVEVLRGPQGTLFGKNTVGGVINVIRSRPTGELGARFKVTAGEDGQQELRAVVNTGLTEDLSLKLFATDISYDGARKNRTNGNKFGDRDYQNLGATFLWEPNDKFEALFTAEIFRDEGTLDYFHTNYNAAPGVLAPPPPLADGTPSPEQDFSGGFVTCTVFQQCRDSLDTPSYAENDKDNDFKLDTDAFTLKMVYDINENLSLTSVTSHRELDEYRFYDYDASAHPFITIERWNEYEQTSQEFRLDGQFNNVTFTAGLYYFNNEFTQDWVTGDGFWAFVGGGFGGLSDPNVWGACVAGALGALSCDPGISSVPAGEDVTQVLYETQETTSYAAFAQMDWSITEDWILTAGLRYTYEEKDFVAGQAYLSNVERQRLRVFPGGYADLDNDWNEISPKIGLTYVINDESMVYATYSEGFKSGGFFGVNQNISDFNRDQYDPEFANNIEVGYKSQHLDNRLRLNITYFRNEFEDKQESIVALDASTGTVASRFDNAANVLYKGFEVETQFVVNQYLRLFANYGYLDASYEEFETDINPNDNLNVVQDASFLTPRNAPENTLGLGGTLSVPMGAGTLEVFGKYTWIDEIEASLLNLNQSRVKSRDDVTATIGYYTNNWSVSVFGRNLTDERFEVFQPIATLFAAGIVNRPRSFGVEFTYEM